MTPPSEHAPRDILSVLRQVIAAVRADEQLSAGLDAYPEGKANVRVRWLSRIRGYEVTLSFGADPLGGEQRTAATVIESARSEANP